MEPYVFWCTPCGKSHAGECPPKKRTPTSLEWTPLFSEWYHEEHLRGSLWVPSHGMSIGLNWQVIAINQQYNTITVDNTHVKCDVRPEAFTEAGQDNGVLRFRLRRVR